MSTIDDALGVAEQLPVCCCGCSARRAAALRAEGGRAAPAFAASNSVASV